jgi:predicted phosphodiesterase
MVPVSGDVLILAGDICACGDEDLFHVFKRFINHYAKKFKAIVHVAGNHEYYSHASAPRSMREVQVALRNLSVQFPNYVFLHDRAICIDKTTFKIQYVDPSAPITTPGLCIVGSTLWTKIPADQYPIITEKMNDYSSIFVRSEGRNVNLTPEHVTHCYTRHSAFLRRCIRQYAGTDGMIIVVHHKPYIPTHLITSTFDCAYHSNFLHYLAENRSLSRKIRAVIYGHTHKYDHETSRFAFPVRSNPKGYPGQQTGYREGEVIEL